MPPLSTLSPAKAQSPAQKKCRTEGDDIDGDIPRMPPEELEQPNSESSQPGMRQPQFDQVAATAVTLEAIEGLL